MLMALFRGLIKLYQLILSPLTHGCCRYAPSCSEYCLEALQCHGTLKGGWLAFKRIMRCHPWGGSGFDPVPSSSHNTHIG